MAWGAIAGAVIGGMMSSDASGDASSAQLAASDRATASNERIFNRQTELQRPFREAGVSGLNRLLYLMGLDGISNDKTEEQIRQSLLPYYTSVSQSSGASGDLGSVGYPTMLQAGQNQTLSYVDEKGLNAAVQKQLEQQKQQSDINNLNASNSGEFGSLLKDFGMADFEADPGYAFRQSEGLKGVQSGAAARGGLLSGAALKAIQKYGQDLASQEYGNAYGRFTANQTNKYNKLAGLANTGQGATNVLTNAAGQLGQSNASNIIGAGNAQASGIIGSANAWNQAIGQGINSYQSNRLMDMIRNPSSNYGSSYVPGYGYGTSYGE